MGFWDGISLTICKQSAPRSRQITALTPRPSIFISRMLFLMPRDSVKEGSGWSQRLTVIKTFSSVNILSVLRVSCYGLWETEHWYELTDVQMKGHQWAHISDDAKDLVHRMLELDQAHRITIDDVLRHPWIRVCVMLFCPWPRGWTHWVACMVWQTCCNENVI